MALSTTATAEDFDRSRGYPGSVAASTRAAQADDGEPMGYFVDSLFRRDATAAAPAAAPTTGIAESAFGTNANERA